MEEKKNNKGLIWLISILIVLVLGLIGFVVYDKVLKVDKINPSSNNTSTTTTEKKDENVDKDQLIEKKLCSKDIIFGEEKYRYDINYISEDIDLKINLYDKNNNLIAKIDGPGFMRNLFPSKEEALKHDYCAQFYIKIDEVASDDKYKYNAIQLIEKYDANIESNNAYQIYSFNNEKYNFIIDLSVFSATGFKDTTTNEIVESYRIKDNSVYVIANSLLSDSTDLNYNTKLPKEVLEKNFKFGEELKFTFKNNTYEVSKTGNNTYEGISGIN